MKDKIALAGVRIARENCVVGVNPLSQAAEKGLLKRLILSDGEARKELTELAGALPFSRIRYVDKREFDDARICDGHQYCAGEISSLPNPDLADVVPEGGPALVVLLDGITDPRNAGAIVRTAAAVGANAVVMPSHRSVRPGPVFYKASAGLAFTIPVCRGLNLSQSLSRLTDLDFWSVAAVGDPRNADQALTFRFPKRTALVFGSEGKGIREKLLEKCDHHVYIPMAEGVESLNVSVAAGILMYLWAMSLDSLPWINDSIPADSALNNKSKR